jgi:hypothetical protein
MIFSKFSCWNYCLLQKEKWDYNTSKALQNIELQGFIDVQGLGEEVQAVITYGLF